MIRVRLRLLYELDGHLLPRLRLDRMPEYVVERCAIKSAGFAVRRWSGDSDSFVFLG